MDTKRGGVKEILTDAIKEKAAELINSDPRIKITIEGFESNPLVIENAKGFYLAADLGEGMQIVGAMRRIELMCVAKALLDKIAEK